MDKCSGFGELAVEALKTLGLGSMRNMPHEIIGKIRQLCPDSLFWRYCEVEHFPVFPYDPEDDRSGPYFLLGDVYWWTRGQKPKIRPLDFEADDGDEEQLEKPARLTFDSWGLQKIERLSLRKSFVHTPSMHYKFVVISSIVAASIRLRFEEPCAQRTFEQLRLPGPEKHSWIFLPISEEDEIVSFRLKLAGYVIIDNGSRSRRGYPQAYHWLSIKRPKYIFYDMTGPCNNIRAVGAHSEGKSTLELRHKQFNFRFDARTYYYEQPNHLTDNSIEMRRCETLSEVCLDNVIAANAFYREEDNGCAGVILKYVNGGQRALGQCRLGIDRVEECISPTHICFAPLGCWPFKSFARFTRDPTGYLEKDWYCQPMTGSLKYRISLDGAESLYLSSETHTDVKECVGQFV
ncbi:hypothetical protein E4U21_005965 [Claviceps maximensis]|nr:hypothetical protein E4U21_005965 [Claviceps maximensis]